MALPSNRIKKIKLPNNTSYDIVPEMLGKNGFSAELPTLIQNSTIALTSDLPSAITSVDGLSGGTITSATGVKGTISVKNSSDASVVTLDQSGYITGTWLRTTSVTDLSGWSDVFVNDGNGWLYKRSKSGLRSDLNIPFANKTVNSNATVTATLSAGQILECTSTSLSSVTLTIDTPSSEIANIYFVRFYAGSTIPTLTINAPSGYTKIYSAATPANIQTYTFYELNIEVQGTALLCSLIPIPNKMLTSHYTYIKRSDNSLEQSSDAGTLVLTNTSSSQVLNAQTAVVGQTYSVSATANSNASLLSLTRNGSAFTNNTNWTISEDSEFFATFQGSSTTITVFGSGSIRLNNNTSGSSSGSSCNVYDAVYVSSGTVSSVSNLTLIASNEYRITGLNPSITFA